MATSKKLTKKEVFQVCQQLQSENKTLSQINVREALGKGSFTTIGPMIAEYKANSNSVSTEITEHQKSIPSELEVHLQSLGQTFWHYASEIAEQERKAFRDELEEKKKEMVSQLKEKDDAIEYLESENEKLGSQLSELTKMKEDFIRLSSQNDSLQSQLLQLSDFNEKLQAIIDDHLSKDKK